MSNAPTDPEYAFMRGISALDRRIADLERRSSAARQVCVGYSESTANDSGISAITFLANLSITFNAVVGRRYRAIAQVEITQTVAGDVWVLKLIDDLTVDVQLQRTTKSNGQTSAVTNHLVYSNNSSISGSKTWRLSLERASGSGTLTASASATNPNLLMIEDVGPI